MKLLSFLLIVSCLGGEICAEEQVTGKIVFPDGDSLPGNPTGVSSEGHLLWESPFLKSQKTPFKTREIDSIRFSASEIRRDEETMATITFQNRIDDQQEVIRAKLLEFNDESIKVETWYAGELDLKRTMLHSIKIESEEPPFLSGPGQLSDWNQIENRDAWTIEADKLMTTTKGSIARHLPELPDQIKIEFMFFFDYLPYLRLFFFADSGTDSQPGNSYSIQIQRNSMNFQKTVNGRSSIDLENEQIGPGFRHNFQNDLKTFVELYLDRKEGKFVLYLDGKKISSATDSDPLQGTHWLHFSTLNGRQQTISDLAIRPWNGKLPKAQDYLLSREELPADSEQVELHNGDTVLGKAVAIDEHGRLQIETKFGPVLVPIARLSSFQVTNKEDLERPRLYTQDVRAHFHHGGYLTLRLSEIDGTHITGYSQVFGEVTLDLAAFSHIEFNPYESSFRKRRGLPF